MLNRFSSLLKKNALQNLKGVPYSLKRFDSLTTKRTPSSVDAISNQKEENFNKMVREQSSAGFDETYITRAKESDTVCEDTTFEKVTLLPILGASFPLIFSTVFDQFGITL